MTTTPITLADLTTATLAGTGVFDVLMQANKAHLEAEYDKDRIRGPEYATVYLGAMEATLNGALQFLLSKQKASLEAALLEQQILLTQAEVAKATAAKLLIDKQIANAVLEGDVLVAQKCKLQAEFDLTVKNVDRTTQETALLLQKIATEKAQTIGSGVDADSVVGRQKSLYQAQTDGFKRDAEQKAAKTLIDTWNVRRTTDEGVSANTTNQLDDASIGRVVAKLLAGVGA